MKTQQSSNQQSRPRVGRLYLQGLTVYLRSRLLDTITALVRVLTAPVRSGWAWLEWSWFRLKPWLLKHKRRLLWSILALVCLSLLVGGGLTLYLWREELQILAFRFREKLSTFLAGWRRQAQPVIVVATQTVEEASAPVAPAIDGAQGSRGAK